MNIKSKLIAFIHLGCVLLYLSIEKMGSHKTLLKHAAFENSGFTCHQKLLKIFMRAEGRLNKSSCLIFSKYFLRVLKMLPVCFDFIERDIFP